MVTLGIIGVVAALTMPALIANYQKQQMVTHLKKVYSVLNQAMRAAEAEHGEYSTWDNAYEMKAEAYCDKYWLPYIKIGKRCTSPADCGYTKKLHATKDFYWYNLDGTSYQNSFMVGCAFKLTDGTTISLRTQGGGGLDDNGQPIPVVASNTIFVDLNGGKAPNTLSKDVFLFTRTDRNGVMPYAYDQVSDTDCIKTTTGGNWCAAKIMYDGWEIKDDYPW